MFGNKLIKAFRKETVACGECDKHLKAMDDQECKKNTDIDNYGYDEESYENLYPSTEEVLEYYEAEDDGYDEETYEEVFNELIHSD